MAEYAHTTPTPILPPARRDLIAVCGAFLLARGTPALAATAAPPLADTNPDAALLGWCAAAIAMEEKWWLDPNEHWQRPTGYYETIDAITATPARTDAGNRAKLAVAVSFYQPDPPEEGSIVGRILWDAMTALASPPVATPVVAESPDAELIAACAEHPSNIRNYNTSDEDDDGPLWNAYSRTRDLISDAKPQTMAGRWRRRARAWLRLKRCLRRGCSTMPAALWANPGPGSCSTTCCACTAGRAQA